VATSNLAKMSKEQLGWLAVGRKLLGVGAILRARSMCWDGRRWQGKFHCPDFTKKQLVQLLGGATVGQLLTAKNLHKNV
jgi:hypothetical protein